MNIAHCMQLPDLQYEMGPVTGTHTQIYAHPHTKTHDTHVLKGFDLCCSFGDANFTVGLCVRHTLAVCVCGLVDYSVVPPGGQWFNLLHT